MTGLAPAAAGAAAAAAAAIIAWAPGAAGAPGRRLSAPRDRPDPLAALGGAVLARLHRAAAPGGRRARRLAGLAVVVSLLVAPAAPPAPVVALVACWGAPVVARRRQAAARAGAVADALPDAIDLLRLASGAGLSVRLALPLVAPHAGAPVGQALAEAEALAAAGVPRADALARCLGALGESGQALGRALADHLRYGTPLRPALDRLAFEARLARRHRAEQAARRVPVRLLLPLVTCVLPAFCLLTVVPLLAGSLQALL